MSVSKNFSWLTGSTFVEASVAFLSNLILVRLLLPSEFGQFAVIFAEVGFVAALGDLRFNTLIISKRDSNEFSAVRRLVALSVAWSTFVFLVVIAYLWSRGIFSVIPILLALGIFLNSLSSAQMAFHERNFDYHTLAILQSGSQLASHALAVVLAFFGFGVLALVLRFLFRSVVLNLYYLMTRGISAYSCKGAKFADLKSYFLGSGVTLWCDGFLEQSVERICILVLDSFYGKEIVGFFYQARRLALIPDQFIGSVLARLTLNYYSNGFSSSRIKEQLLPTALAFLIYSVVIYCGIMFLAKPLIPLIFGEGWIEVASMLHYLIPFSCGVTILHVYRAQIYSRGDFMKFIIHGRVPQMLVFSLGFLTVVHSTVNQNIFISFYAFAFLLAGFSAGLCNYRLIAGSSVHEAN